MRCQFEPDQSSALNRFGSACRTGAWRLSDLGLRPHFSFLRAPTAGAERARLLISPMSASEGPLFGDESAYATAGALRWRELDGEWLVYVPATGTLFAPPPLAAAVLVLLEDAPQRISTLLPALSQAAGEDVGAQQVLAVLRELCVLGVVEVVV